MVASGVLKGRGLTAMEPTTAVASGSRKAANREHARAAKRGPAHSLARDASDVSQSVCVIGAGSAGLTAIRELRLRAIDVVCYEKGSQIGGNWRYENDNGVSSAYASLRCNVSRRRMEYAAFPMPECYGEFVSHSDMAAYLDAYSSAFGLREHIRFNSSVERITHTPEGWSVTLTDGSVHSHDAVIVANGHDWEPHWPDLKGRENATIPITHSHTYRTPEPHLAKRTLIIGTGQSACEIATELARTVGHTTISARSGAHIIPRRMFGRVFDEVDVPLLNRLPWRAMNAMYDAGVKLCLTPTKGLPAPPWRILEQVPVVSSELSRSISAGQIKVTPATRQVDGALVTFADGSTESFDHIICATGYRLSFPFIDPGVLEHTSKEISLYRRIVPPDHPELFLLGFVDAPSGNLKIFEAQMRWIADVLQGRIQLPAADVMRAAAARPEPRTMERFPREASGSIRTDAHAYRRNLGRDRRGSNSPSVSSVHDYVGAAPDR